MSAGPRLRSISFLVASSYLHSAWYSGDATQSCTLAVMGQVVTSDSARQWGTQLLYVGNTVVTIVCCFVPSAALMLSHTGALLRAWIRIACAAAAARQTALDPCSFLHGEGRRRHPLRTEPLVVSSLCSSGAASQGSQSDANLECMAAPPYALCLEQITYSCVHRPAAVPRPLQSCRSLTLLWRDMLRPAQVPCPPGCLVDVWYSSIASITAWLRSLSGPVRCRQSLLTFSRSRRHAVVLVLDLRLTCWR
jgi:hypothetical protein